MSYPLLQARWPVFTSLIFLSVSLLFYHFDFVPMTLGQL